MNVGKQYKPSMLHICTCNRCIIYFVCDKECASYVMNVIMEVNRSCCNLVMLLFKYI